MLSLIINLFLCALVLIVTAELVPGFAISNIWQALLAVVLIGLINFLIRPILILLTLPLNLITLGLFSFVINALLLNVAAGLIDGFDINSWTAAIVGAVVLALIQVLINLVLPGKRKLIG